MLLETFPSRAEFADLVSAHSVVPVGAKILADTETPVSLLSRFARDRPDIFLLESAEGGERWGRYSFLGISARANITVYGHEVVFRQGINENRTRHNGDPLAVMREIMRPYRLAELPGLPRFCGGLVGYFAYEMASFFEPRVPNKLPPESPLAEFMIPDAMLIFDNISHTLTVMALAFKDDGDSDALYDGAVSRVQDMLAVIGSPADVSLRINKSAVKMPEPVRGPDYFKGMVRSIKESIREGEVIQ
ncbi:MAG: anthranilate synthase component I, partial [Kiritimatiellae bacterium]|nr:anthranilate synthase component I [Kiritimatiellia bacterium]